MGTAQCLDFHQFTESYLHGLRAQDVTTEAHFVSYFSKILQNKLRRRLACPEHIKDVQQETLLRAWAAVRAEGGIRQTGAVWRVCEFGVQQHTSGIVSFACAYQGPG